IEHVKESISIRDHHDLTASSAEVNVRQDGRVSGIPIMRVMRRELIIPAQFAGIRIEREKTIRIEIVSLATAAEIQWRRIAGSPVDQIEVGIVAAGYPGRTSAVLRGVLQPGVPARFVRQRHGPEPPGFLS